MTPNTNTTFEGGETFILPKWLAQQVEGDSERIAELADLFREVRTRYLAKSLEEFAEKLKDEQTFAQWVLEREEPIGFDKSVVTVAKIDEILALMENK